MIRYKEFCPNCAFEGCQDAERLVADKSINAIKCPHWKGLWKYRELPEGMRPATLRDMLDGEEIMIGIKYLLHSFYAGHFQSYKTSERTNLEDLKAFINEGRCYIKST